MVGLGCQTQPEPEDLTDGAHTLQGMGFPMPSVSLHSGRVSLATDPTLAAGGTMLSDGLLFYLSIARLPFSYTPHPS